MLYKIKKLYLKKEKSKERNKKSTNGIVLKNIKICNKGGVGCKIEMVWKYMYEKYEDYLKERYSQCGTNIKRVKW